MQKKIIALAIAAAFAAPVAAMADVTTYGSMDGGFRHQTNASDAQGTTDSMQMGQYNTARWGFKAVDDMGDGMKANVVLETSFAPGGVGARASMTAGNTFDAGTGAAANAVGNDANPFGLIFDRQATVGLEGGFGKFDMGWNYTTSYTVIGTYDPMAYKFNDIALAKSSALASRKGNLVYSKSLGEVTVMAEYDVTDATKTSQPQQNNPGRALGVTYASGAINAGAAYSVAEANPNAGDTPTTHMTIGAGYNYGDGKVMVGYANKNVKSTGSSDAKTTNMWLGANFNMSAKTMLTAAYYMRNVVAANQTDEVKTNVAMINAVYAMSKKTSVYLGVDRSTVVQTGSADAVTIGTSAGLDVKF